MTAGPRPTPQQVEAAARALIREGNFYKWWPSLNVDYDTMDVIGREEFEAIILEVLWAAEEAKGETP